jgi:SAM-dependent methyltransferase
MCGTCASLERHRLIWLFFKNCTNLFNGQKKKVLHIAPEISIGRLLANVQNIEYLSGDLTSGKAMVEMDITDIHFLKNTFDIIYCSHVLEHVPDDRAAMREFHRVLKPGGWAVLQVPITAPTTFEDPSVTDPAERIRLFGQDDHVRRYGPDYRDRLVETGFRVDVNSFVRTLPQRAIRKFGLDANEEIYYCTKDSRGD